MTPRTRRDRVVTLLLPLLAVGAACTDRAPTAPLPLATPVASGTTTVLAADVADQAQITLEDVRLRLLPAVATAPRRQELDAMIVALEEKIASNQVNPARVQLGALVAALDVLSALPGGRTERAADLDAVRVAFAYLAAQLAD